MDLSRMTHNLLCSKPDLLWFLVYLYVWFAIDRKGLMATSSLVRIFYHPFALASTTTPTSFTHMKTMDNLPSHGMVSPTSARPRHHHDILYFVSSPAHRNTPHYLEVVHSNESLGA